MGDSSDFSQLQHQRLALLRIGRESAAHRVRIDSLSLTDTLRVTESNETRFAMVPPRSAHTDPTERQVMVHHLHQCLIDNESSRVSFILDLLDIGRALAEQIDDQGFWAIVDLLYHVVEVGVGKEGHDWTEDLFGHHQAVLFGFLDDCWADVELVFVDGSSIDYGAFMLVFE